MAGSDPDTVGTASTNRMTLYGGAPFLYGGRPSNAPGITGDGLALRARDLEGAGSTGSYLITVFFGPAPVWLNNPVIRGPLTIGLLIPPITLPAAIPLSGVVSTTYFPGGPGLGGFQGSLWLTTQLITLDGGTAAHISNGAQTRL